MVTVYDRHIEGMSVPTERPPRRPMSGWRMVLWRKAMSARAATPGRGLPMTQYVVCQINALPSRRTHGPCAPTSVWGRFWSREWRLRTRAATPWRGYQWHNTLCVR